ncbi:MAG: RnfABCDGE type electron transport complex subunit D [Nitrospinota bacterium]
MGDIQFIISSSPHIRSEESIPKIMYSVIIALIPAIAASIFIFGVKALWLIVTCTVVSILTEYIFQKIRKKDVTTIDGSAALAGILLALTLPPGFPYTAAALGSIVAIALGKHIFGGLGYNIFNPALIGRAFLQAAFPVLITTWERPLAWLSEEVDAVTAATPLSMMKFDMKIESLSKMLIGNVGGSLGETSAIALLLGAAFLLYKGYIQWRIPAGIFTSVVIFGGIFWIIDPSKYPDPLFHILAGGMLIGAFFMATDMVTSPITYKGYWIFGIGIGILTIIIRLKGGLPEGVMYSILLMNAITPLINRYTRPRILGRK